ncbi:unnamed protein product [Closterium sp. NIES-53]
MTTLRVLLHVAAQRDYELHSLDFSTAFLQGSLHEEIWLRRPPGFTGSFPPDTQWSLRRPVYGLRQAPREWHDTLRTTLAALGFAPSTADTSLPPFYILVYVDDLVFATADTAGLAHVKSELQKRHTCTDLEPSGPYPELVGCLMYLMTCTRPDLAYPLSILARYVAPGRHRPEHMAAAKRVLRYLCSTSGLGLVLGGRRPVVLTGHADASWADDQARPSTLGPFYDSPIRSSPAHHMSAQAPYGAVVARYSSPATAALGRLLLPYLFPELSTFATVEELVTHLRTSDTRYRIAVPAEFLDRNPPPMDHFLALEPTVVNVDLLEQHLLAAETSVVAVGAARGTPRTPFFEGCSPSPLAPSYASAAAVDVLGAEEFGAASTSGKCRRSKGKGGRGGGGGSGGGGGGSRGGGGGSGGGGGGGSGGGSGGFGGGGGGSSGGGGSGGSGSGGRRAGATQRGGSGGGQRQQQQCWSKTPSGVAIFDLDYDAILAAMYALSVSAEGDCYLSVLPDPGIETNALGASESALPSTAPAEALHTFTLDSGASRCFFCDSTTLTPLSAPVPVRLADPSRGPILARSSTVLPCPARVSICTCTRTGCHLATFTRQPGSSLYKLATEPPEVAASAQVSVLGPVAPPFSCRLLLHQTLPRHHRLGHPSLPRLRGVHSCLLFSGLPSSLPPLPPSPAPPCLPCIEGRQRAAPHSSSFPPTTAPLHTLHMDVWGPARVNGRSRERYFLLVVDDYKHYITIFPLRSKGEVSDVLIPWIRAVRLQLRERFRQDLPVLRLHSDRGGEVSSNLLRDLCHGEGILQSFTLPASPQKNGIAERRIGLVMEVARTSMIHAAALHFPWPFALWYAAHQLNLWPRVSLPETSPTLRWTGEVGDASVFRVWGSRAFVRDTSADKLSACAIPCVFLGFPPDAPGWQFYHPTSRRVFPSQDITFDESVPSYRLFPYRSTPPPPAPLFLAPGPPPVDPLPPQGPAPSGAASGGAVSEGAGSRVAEPGGAEPGGAELAGVEPGGAEPEGVDPGGAESKGAESRGAEPWGTASSGGPAGASPRLSPRPEPLSPQQLREWFAQRTRLRSGAAGAGDSAAGDTGAGGVGATCLGGSGVTAGAGGTRGAAAAGPGGARTRGTRAASTGSVGGAEAGGAGAGDPAELGGAKDRGVGAGGTGAGGAGAGGAGAGDTGAVGAGAGDTRAGGAGTGDTGAVVPGAGGAGGGGAMSGGTGAGGTVRPRPYFVPLLQQVLGLPSSTVLTPPVLCPPPDQSQPPLQPASPLLAPSPYTEQTGGLTEHREPESCPTSPVRAVRTGRRVPRPRPPPIPGTHAMALRPCSVPLRVPLPLPPASSLPAVSDPESDLARAANPTVYRLLATIVTEPSFESTVASPPVAELVNFAAACRLDYATALVAESESASPPSVEGKCALRTDDLEDRKEDFECLAAAVPRFASMLLAPKGDPDALDIPTPRSYTEAITGPYSSQWQTAMDAEMASWKSTGTYVDAVPPSGANIVDGMWIFRVKRPPGSPTAFKARYVARGFSQRHGVDYFQTFSPTPKMTTLRVLLHVAAQRDYELHSLDFITTFLQGSLHEEIWLRRPPGFTRSFPAGTQWSLRRPVHGLGQVPREWHDTLRTTLAVLGFTPSTTDPTLFLHTDTSLLPFYVLVYVDDLVFATAYTEARTLVKSELQKRHTCTNLGELRSYLGLQIIRDRARRTITLTQSHIVQQVLQRFGFQYSFAYRSLALSSTFRRVLHWAWGSGLDDGVQLSSLVTQMLSGSNCEAEIYAGAMAAQELRWHVTVVFGKWGKVKGGDDVKPAAPVARETVDPVAREPVAPVAHESVAPTARLAAEPVTPFARVLVAPFASAPVAPVARVPAASAATHHLLSSHGPSSSSLSLSFLRYAWCTPSGGVVHKGLLPAASSPLASSPEDPPPPNFVLPLPAARAAEQEGGGEGRVLGARIMEGEGVTRGVRFRGVADLRGGRRGFCNTSHPPPPPLSLPAAPCVGRQGGSLEVKGVAGRGSAAPAPPSPPAPPPFSSIPLLRVQQWGGGYGGGGLKPVAPIARETFAPVAREPVAPVACDSVAPAACLATESVTPIACVTVAPFASVPVAPVARVPAASVAAHHLLSSHGPSSSSLALSFFRCAGCTPSWGVLHMAIPACS